MKLSKLVLIDKGLETLPEATKSILAAIGKQGLHILQFIDFHIYNLGLRVIFFFLIVLKLPQHIFIPRIPVFVILL